MLYLTYLKQNDGMCAQYQRIISIIALAMKYDCQYIHSYIEQMEHLPQPNTEYLKNIEDFLKCKIIFLL